MAGRAFAQVVAEQFAVHRVSAVVDDFVGTLDGALSAQVGYALIGDDHIH